MFPRLDVVLAGKVLSTFIDSGPTRVNLGDERDENPRIEKSVSSVRLVTSVGLDRKELKCSAKRLSTLRRALRMEKGRVNSSYRYLAAGRCGERSDYVDEP